MAGILLNLLAVSDGGQVTRSAAFLKRFRRFDSITRLVILKDRDSLLFCDDFKEYEVINFTIGKGRTRVIRRVIWENIFLPQLMRKHDLNIYLTFSHYLPFMLGSHATSIVGVSNLAPFSMEAWKVESYYVRIKMALLRRLIVSSTKPISKTVWRR